ncbi:branched-chain amino acid ABC transporter permease, partial [Streptomyces ipomoeae]
MTTNTTTTPAPTAKHDSTTKGLVGIPENIGRALATGGGVLAIISTFLAWTWTAAFPGNLTVYGYPGGLQILVLIGGALTTLFGLASYGIKGLRWLTPAGADSAIKLAATGTFVTAWYTILAISIQLGGIVNLEPGGFVVALATLAALLGALALPFERPQPEIADPEDTAWEEFQVSTRNTWSVIKACFASGTATPARQLPAYAEILVIVAALALGLTVFTYGIGTEYDELFVGFLITAGFGFAALTKAGLVARLSAITTKHRTVTMIGAFVAAAAFPFTQSDDRYATIGVYILIFATVALGLNIVVGLAGLLDLGYVAFLGVGAYTAAMVSGSPSSPFDIHLPFWASAILG